MKHEILAPGVEIYCADCMEMLPMLPVIDAAITSPPYNLGAGPWPHLGNWKQGDSAGGKSKWRNGSDAGNGIQYGIHKDSMPWPDYVDWQRNVLGAIWGRLSRNGVIFYNHKPRVIGAKLWQPTELIPQHCTIRQIVIWARPGGINFNSTAFVPTHEWIMVLAKQEFRLKSKGVSGFGDVWRINPDENEHPAPFPVSLPARALEAIDGQIVLDPFMGSGTTGVAAVKLGRRFIGIEIEEKYYALARERITKAIEERDMDMFKDQPIEPIQEQLI